MCNGYTFFEDIVSLLSKDWAYLADFVVQDVLYAVLDMGDEIDILNNALGRPQNDDEELFAEEGEIIEEDATNFQVETEGGEEFAGEGQPMGPPMQMPNFYDAGQSIGRMIGRLFKA